MEILNVDNKKILCLNLKFKPKDLDLDSWIKQMKEKYLNNY